MCARFTVVATAEEIQESLAMRLAHADAFFAKPEYNIAPSRGVAVVLDHGEPHLETAVWGLTPWWEMKQKLPFLTIENLATKKTFHRLVKEHRCLMPATGFYEWRGAAGHKEPFYFFRTDHKPFAFAALSQRNEAGDLECALLTTQANQTVAQIHTRMPVMLSGAAARHWLDATDYREAILSVMEPLDASLIACYPVTKRMSNPRYQEADAVTPVAPRELPKSLFD